jgi:hypothetical protein
MPRARSLALAGCALALAACGSSASSSTGSNASGASAGIKFADCMRSHGVPNFPDPAGGGGIKIPVGSGINPQSPAFQSAQRACGSLLPGPGSVGGQASESDKLRMLAMSRCMRAHGLPSFPDPVTKPPAPGAGFGIAFGRPGAFIAIPTNLVQSPAFTQAASTCGLPGAGGHRPKANVAAP